MPRTGGKRPRNVYPKDIVQHVSVRGKTGPGRGGVMGTPPPDEGGERGMKTILTLPPAQFVPPPGSIDFSASATSVVGPGPATVVVAGFELPVGRIGVIRSLLFEIQNSVVSTLARFSVTLNEGPVPGWTYDVFPKAAAFSSLSFGPDETFILTPSAALVGFLITISDAGTYTVGATFHGWHISKRTAVAYGLSGVV